jgi:hypothetical protein
MCFNLLTANVIGSLISSSSTTSAWNNFDTIEAH